MTLSRFAQKARDEVDLDQLAVELLRVVDETMQPESVGLWLQPVGDKSIDQKASSSPAIE